MSQCHIMMMSHSKHYEFPVSWVRHVKRRQARLDIDWILYLWHYGIKYNSVVVWYGPPDIPRGVGGRRADGRSATPRTTDEDYCSIFHQAWWPTKVLRFYPIDFCRKYSHLSRQRLHIQFIIPRLRYQRRRRVLWILLQKLVVEILRWWRPL